VSYGTLRLAGEPQRRWPEPKRKVPLATPPTEQSVAQGGFDSKPAWGDGMASIFWGGQSFHVPAGDKPAFRCRQSKPVQNG
jgi:hypothetical protein